MSKLKEQRTDLDHRVGPAHGARPAESDDQSSIGVAPQNKTVSAAGKRSLSPSSSRLLVSGLGLLLVVGIAAVATQVDKTVPAEKETAVSSARPLAVDTLIVGQVQPEPQTRSYSGMLVAQFESQLSFERPGRVAMMGPTEGTFVEPGTVLARLAQDDLDATQQRIESELAAAQAVLAELVAGPREQTIQAATARVNELQARVQLAETDAKRQSKLAPQGATSQSQVDTASFGFEASRQSLVAARALLEELNEGTRKEQIAAQRAKCDAIRGSLREIQADREDSQIVAPFAGAIQSRLIDEGVVVSPGSPALHLVSHSLEARISLPPAVAQSLPAGSEVLLRFNQHERNAWVDRVSPAINQDTRTRDVFVRFANSEVDASTALFAELAQRGWVVGEIVELMVAAGDDAIENGKHWLPISSLTRGARGLWTVLAVPGSESIATCERRSVELLKIDGTHALVQGMLEKGERIIADGLHRVTAGMIVQTVSSSAGEFDSNSSGSESLASDVRVPVR